jgi:PIN domain nuclease of toxin-antitoxin system
VILLDTHAWVWWISDPRTVSRGARRAIEAAVARGQLHVSSISVWEIALLVARKRLRLTMDVASWIARSEALPFLTFVPVDNRIALRSTALPGPLHDDPADRMIIATALALGAELVTRDEKIHGYGHVRTVW